MEPGGLNIQELLQQAQAMQEQLFTAQRELAEAEVKGTAGGGLVTATVNGAGEVTGLSIDPKAVDPDDPADTAETIADLVLAAIRDASREAQELQQEKMGPFAEGLGGMPGLGGGQLPGGFPGLGGGAPGGPGA
ncbi:YbaB/EbfC family nucleoid-associated protein [Actinomadura rubrisoli]|uniref:Nucleoid-associated protein E1298_46200 n=1 Tax=Actinomadura rubrisoli TaxID=2530368 RepID=A0A4R4ZQQ4_9ACTN|nr:YbaB/EbfC family nucleoid-associated protein [Actinomadura rubrisoli]TDD60229.1 YbaB/EbfC family nucleoid-associated protein [Actinomadura rubrisoli]